MAKGNVSLSYKIVIDGQQAKDEAKKLEASIDKASKAVAKLKKDYEQALAAGADKATLDGLSQQLKAEQANLKTLNKLWKDRVVQINGYEKQLKNLANLDYNQLTRLQSTLQRALKKLSPEDDIKSYQKLLEYIRQVDHELSGRKADFKNYDESRKKMNEMAVAMKNVSALTDKQLVEQKSYWAAVSKGVDETSRHYKRYQQFIKEAADEEQRRKSVSAQQTITDIELGNWDKTIAESKEAVKQLQQYRDTLKDTDKVGLERVDKAIADLNARIKGAQEGVLSMTDALAQANNLKTFKGTIQDLEDLKKRLQEIRQNEIEIGGANSVKNIQDIDKALSNVTVKIAQAKGGVEDFDDFIKDINTKSFEDLQQAASQLETELKHAAQNSDEFIKKSAQLRTVNKELDGIKKQWKEQGNVVEKTAKRLMAYVAIYGGFNEIIDKMKEILKLNLELSDSMADVQKTTGLAGRELQELGRNIERIDSRTTTAQLYELAAAAGQIGLKTQEDVLGFTKAANTISVALSELGGEGSATLMKIAALTGDVAKSGTEQALLKIGSAINELTANSAATAGPIADFISRVGGIASSAKIAIHEMAALGAATDASAQSVEIAGTSMNKLITALVSNTENIAYAANLNAKELKTLIMEENTMQAIIKVLEVMQTMDRGAVSGVMKELGSEGARMNQYVASLVANLDMLKRQLDISREGFEENVSVVNEYNVKQESALGILNRMKNSFMDTFVNSRMTAILTDILKTISAIPAWFEKHRLALLALRAVIASIFAMRLPMLLNAFMKSISGTYALLSGPIIAAWGAFRNSILASTVALELQGVATTGLIGKLRILWTVIVSNPIGAIATAVTAAAVAWWHFNEETDEAVKATAELSEKHTRQIEELNALRAALEASNTAYLDRAEAMRQINSLYSKYLGFELSELDYYGKKAAALDYINAKLKEEQTLELANRQKEVYNEEFSKDAQGDIEGITEALIRMPEIGAKRLTEAMGVINQAIKDGARTSEEVISELEKHFNTVIEFSDKENSELIAIGGAVGAIANIFIDTELESLEEYIGKYGELQDKLVGTDEYFHEQKLKNQQESDEALTELATKQANKIRTLEAESDKASEEEQIAHLQRLLKEKEEYQKTAEKMLQRAKETDEAFVAENTYKDNILDVRNLTAKYGKAVRVQALAMNKAREEMQAIQKKQADNDRQLQEAANKLQQEQQKENNYEQIELAKQDVEAKKRLRDELNQELIRKDMQWSDDYIRLQQLASSETREIWRKTAEDLETDISALKTKIAGDPWGKMFNIGDWKEFPKLIEGLEGASEVSLAEAFKNLRNNTKLITKDVESFNKMFKLEVPLENPDQVNMQVFDWLNQIRQELKRRNRGTTGEVLWGNAKEEMDFVLNSIQAHFLQRQKQIQDSYLNGMITGEEMERRLDANNKELLQARIQFRKMMLGEENSFSDLLIPGLEDHDLVKVRTEIAILGDEVTDEIRKSLAEDENLVSESAIKIRKALEKELLSTDMFETLRQNFKGSLDELMLMSSEYERKLIDSLRLEMPEVTEEELGGLTEEKMQERLNFLIELARKSYTVDADGLRKMFDSHEQYYAWVDKLDDEQMNVLLNKLRWFYDQELVAYKNYTTQLKKELDSSYNQQQLKLGDAGKIQWNIDQLKSQMKNLDPLSEEYKAREQLINEYEEKLLKLRKDTNDKNKQYRSKQEREAKEQYEASISALQAYYNEQEAVIREKAISNNWTQAQLDRELRRNMLARERDLIELRKLLLGELSEFDPMANEGYKGAITGHVFFGDEKNLNKQKTQIARWGSDLMDGMRNQIAKGSITIQEAMKKLKDNIEKILLEDDFTGKVAQQYLESIDELGLLFNVETEKTDISKEESKARLTAMQDYANRSYSLTAKQLEDEMALDKTFSQWRIGRTEKDYEALLLMLRKFHDDQEEADRKAAERRKKIMESSAKGRALTQKNEANIRSEEENVEMWDRFKGMDLVTDDTVDRAQIDVYQAKIAASQAWIEQIEAQMAAEKAQLAQEMTNVQTQISLMKMRGEDTANLEAQFSVMQSQYRSITNQQDLMALQHKEEIADATQEIYNRQVAIEQRKVSEMKKYTDAIVDFSGQMGEAAWGEVEDRQEAGKQLVKSLLTTLKDWAAAKLTELAMQQLFATQSNAIAGSEMITSLTAEGAAAAGSVAINSVKATAKETGKLGLKGLLVGAAISAALSALLGVAMGALNKRKSEVASTTGASGGGKLATGMLTYAEGNYPVLGNDGKVYNARYEGKGMKTGVYGGGAHFGIFSEKQPEAIIDGKTTQRLMLNYPEIWKSIVTLSRVGKIERGMRTFATGNIQEIAAAATTADGTATAAQNEATLAMMNDVRALMAANMALMNKLATDGVKSSIDMYGNGGMYKSMEKASRFAKRRGY